MESIYTFSKIKTLALMICVILFGQMVFLGPSQSAIKSLELRKGPYKIEDLGVIIKSATLEHHLLFFLPEAKQYHLLLYYVIEQYRQKPFQIWDINLDTGTSRLAAGVIGRPAPVGTLLHSNGLIYIATGDPGFLIAYDPATGHTREIGRLADKGAQNIIEGDDGAVYIGECIKGYVERYDPKDGTWENYGIIDDPGPPYYRYVYTLGADRRYMYLAMGENPWYLVIYDRRHKTQAVYWKDLKPRYVGVYKSQGGGWVAHCLTSDSKNYSYELKGGLPPKLLKFRPKPDPTPSLAHGKLLPKFVLDLDQAAPDTGNRGKATVRWRRDPLPPWRQASAHLHLAPMKIKRLYASSASTLLGTTPFYGPVFTYDPGTRKLSLLGRPRISIYAALLVGGQWYLAGYPSAIMQYDPHKPWTITASTQNLYGPLNNPRLLKIAPPGWAKYYYSLAAGADGNIYLGGHHERTGVGGSLGWYDPRTGWSGGLREPFLQYDVTNLIAAQNGAKIVFSSHSVKPGVDGKIFIFDVHQKKLTGSLVPLPGERDAGQLLEVAPGVVLGVAAGRFRSWTYQVDLSKRRVLWKTELKGRPSGRLTMGPGGQVWIYLNHAICRINPIDGSVREIIAAAPPGNLLFLGKELYIYGGTSLRRVSGLFQTISEK
jgi:outer membrane protein assembly factor BamB